MLTVKLASKDPAAEEVRLCEIVTVLDLYVPML